MIHIHKYIKLHKTPNTGQWKLESIKYPQVPYSRDAGGYCPVTGEPGGFYLEGVKTRGNGDAALTGDPPVTFKGTSGQEKNF